MKTTAKDRTFRATKVTILLLAGVLAMLFSTYFGFATFANREDYRASLILSLALDFFGIVTLAMTLKALNGFWGIIPAVLIIYGLSIAPQAIQRLSLL